MSSSERASTAADGSLDSFSGSGKERNRLSNSHSAIVFPSFLCDYMCLCKCTGIHRYKCKSKRIIRVSVVPRKYLQIRLVSKEDKRTFVLHSSAKWPLYMNDASPFIICIIFPIIQLCMGKNLTLQDTLIRCSSLKPDSWLSNAYAGLTLSSSVVLLSLHLSPINRASNKQHASHVCHNENTRRTYWWQWLTVEPLPFTCQATQSILFYWKMISIRDNSWIAYPCRDFCCFLRPMFSKCCAFIDLLLMI